MTVFPSHLFLAALALSLPLAATGGQIYKWIDRGGTVHFSDKPNPERDSQTVTIAPAPTRQQVEEARWTGQKIQQTGTELAEQNARIEKQRQEQAERRRQQQAEAEEQQRRREETNQREDSAGGWYYGGVGIHPRPPRPRPPIHKPRPPAIHPVPSPLPNH